MKLTESAVLGGLTAVASFIALAMAMCRLATWLESISFVTGAVCVWLTVKQDVRSFPIGLVNVATFCVVFYRSGLIADAGLQVVYMVLGIIGWYAWLHGGDKGTRLQISRAPRTNLAVIIACVALGTVGLRHVLEQLGGSATFWDALTTSLSLASQWLLNRKRLETWIGWILVDVIYMPLYFYKELYLTAALYGVFLAMAVMGLIAWRAAYRQQLSEFDLRGCAEGVGP